MFPFFILEYFVEVFVSEQAQSAVNVPDEVVIR